MIRLAVGIVVAYGLLVGCLYIGQRKLLYHPPSEMPDRERYDADDMAEVRFETADGLTLFAWYKPASAGKPTLVHLHGNAGHVGHRVDKMRPMMEAGYGMLLVEWRGFAGNPGSPTEDGLNRDADAALAWLEAEGVPPERIVLYGESLGTGVAVRLAAENDSIAAIILEAPYRSIAEVAAEAYPYVPAQRLVKDRYDSLPLVPGLSMPVLVIHGELDRTIRPHHGRAVLEAAEQGEGRFFPNAGHNDLYGHGAAEAVLDFLGRKGTAAD